MSTTDTPERARFFGRSKGKALRRGQRDALDRLLPRLLVRLPDPREPALPADALHAAPEAIGGSHPLLELDRLFDRPMAGHRLEIGFGGGEHLVHRAQEIPDVGFIGVEPFVNGMAKLMLDVERLGLSNIRVFDNDATMLLRRLPEGCLDAVDLLYADPWPKRRQRKRRFVSTESLELIAHALKPGGVFRFASDIDDYVGWTLARILPMPDFRWCAEAAPDWTTPFPGWPGTRYEAKAMREGRTPSYLSFKRR